MTIQVGDALPSVDLYEETPDKKVNTSEFCKGKVVIFGLPGAFTPTCSSEHAPGFVKSVDELKSKGVSQVICVSVNDPFVMAAWGKAQDPAGKVRFLADPRGEFTKKLGLEVDMTEKLGNFRCKRCVLVVENGKMKSVNVEPSGTGYTCTRAVDALKLV